MIDMAENLYFKEIDQIDDTITVIKCGGEDFAWFLSDGFTEEQIDKVIDKLNEYENELKKFKPVIFKNEEDGRLFEFYTKEA